MALAATEATRCGTGCKELLLPGPPSVDGSCRMGCDSRATRAAEAPLLRAMRSLKEFREQEKYDDGDNDFGDIAAAALQRGAGVRNRAGELVFLQLVAFGTLHKLQ